MLSADFLDAHPKCVKDKSKLKTRLIKPAHKLAAEKPICYHQFQQGFKGVRKDILLSKKEILTHCLSGKSPNKVGFVE